MENDTLLKTGEVADLLGVSRQHVVDLCNRGDLPSVKIGTHRRVRRADVEEILQAHTLTYEQRKQLWLHQALLTHLLTKPDATMSLARKNIRRWSSMHRPDGKANDYLREWEKVLDDGLERTVETVLSSSLRSCELRQNSPFAGVLSQTERMAALTSFRATHDWSAA
ncbi:helix-turn-helix domain-containing protein [Ornithinimicrobium faecis]|uniref:Helix-turn-helix domain-containing protein n=1 Tax=Ornithinimicrobium faecis TaxID=2934158 RepID=A0ABY4YYI0_9MICO|nr:helix-turn-helix domain-containing protein [Ornithinimicrobium sp. HY1793]USQ81510.1 helix-turn-helix domain-containing protein [Ornithinimicrobium sp. HY1793]